MGQQENPFRIHGPVRPPHFVDRETEVARILRTLAEPGTKLLVYGERRMGKTSALAVALERFRAAGGIGFMADLSTASTVADMANRILDAATQSLSRTWKDMAADVARHVGVKLSLEADPVTGLPRVSLDVGLRQAEADEQRQTLTRVLDSLERLARERRTALGVVLDEFQEIHRFGGEGAEWHLRGAIQHHDNLSYVLAGSKTGLIERMMGRGGAFYGLLDRLIVGPIEAAELAGWIDRRMEGAGMETLGVGTEVVALAGPRTRDVVQLARRCFELGHPNGVADASTVREAFLQIVHEEDEPLRSFWQELTPHQQNVLRAVAASEEGLTTANTLRRFSLSSSAAVASAVKKFVDSGVFEKGGPAGYRFDSPFARGWVIANTLEDIGLRLPATYRPGAAGRGSSATTGASPET